MQILSEIVKIPNNNEPSTEYIEEELRKKGFDPLRWAIVKVTKDNFVINLAYNK